MKLLHLGGLIVVVVLLFVGAELPRAGSKGGDTASYKDDVAPLLKKYCMPCHAEENYNPSELSLDSYALLMKGGKHGDVVVPGEPDESTIMQKLSENPPFGERMPLHSKRKKNPAPPKYLEDDEVKLLAKWISQGAQDN
jgi:hypothetical protein